MYPSGAEGLHISSIRSVDDLHIHLVTLSKRNRLRSESCEFDLIYQSSMVDQRGLFWRQHSFSIGNEEYNTFPESGSPGPGGRVYTDLLFSGGKRSSTKEASVTVGSIVMRGKRLFKSSCRILINSLANIHRRRSGLESRQFRRRVRNARTGNGLWSDRVRRAVGACGMVQWGDRVPLRRIKFWID